VGWPTPDVGQSAELFLGDGYRNMVLASLWNIAAIAAILYLSSASNGRDLGVRDGMLEPNETTRSL
jgi:hypothetical protein